VERNSYDIAYLMKWARRVGGQALVLGLLAGPGACGGGDAGAPDAAVRSDVRRDTSAATADASATGGRGGTGGAGGAGAVDSGPPEAGATGTGGAGGTAGAAGAAGAGGTAGTGGTAGAAGTTAPPVPVDAGPSPPPVDGGPRPPPTGPLAMPVHSPRSVALYDESKVVDFYLTFPPGEFEKLKAPPGPGDARWVNCGFRFETDTAPAAHCRRKGNPEDWKQEIKPAMLVRFNFIDKMGRFRGLRRINLEIFDGFEAPVRDRLGMWMMREAGIDAPRVNHARVFKDGQLYGLYMNVETVDKEFLEDHFSTDGEGNLWDDSGELKTNETINDNSRLIALNQLVAAEPLAGDHTAFFTKLDAMIDVSQFLREMAAETVMLTDDNFSNGSSNFLYYDHPKRGFMVLPWDLDTILSSGPVNADPFAFWGSSPPNKMRQLMNQNPTWKTEFVNAAVEIRDGVLARAPAKLDAICEQISGAVREDPTRTANFEDFQRDCAGLRGRIAGRIAALKQSLGR
jgi:hypothetical protein